MIRIGKIVHCHGIKGELSLLPLTDHNERFEKLKKAFLELSDGQYQEVEVTGAREHKGNILLTFANVQDRTQAERWKNLYLCVREEDAVKPEGAYFHYEIIGLEVYEGTTCYGTIKEILQHSSTDLYVVSDGKREFYLPALKAIIQKIDLAQGKMEVALPAGLLD